MCAASARMQRQSLITRLTLQLVDVCVREPPLLALLDQRAVPPRALRIFGGVRLDHHILNEGQVDVALSVIREQSSDSDRWR